MMAFQVAEGVLVMVANVFSRCVMYRNRSFAHCQEQPFLWIVV
jgi:hypothetical protein